LSGFVRRTARSIKTYSAENAEGLREVIRTLKGDGA
ncbi:MAG TPA: malonyl CoA-ACP transacylase, partial [Ruminococcaceae bacterium]|nr:malonyl CoA-ACP transacylase [Oscillospiraceae bacterium]